MIINIPNYINEILTKLNKNGFKAYIVGGCIRDSITGKAPYDWDICTSALPKQIKTVLCDYKTFDSGIKHGTVSVLVNTNVIEITTFRKDGDYLDSRHPLEVTFVDDIKEDLKRRDFTINAMAYNDNGLVDLFGGINDINKRLIRCVGDPDKRFNEDALRILRALRFASCLDFEIEKETSLAIHRNKDLLKNISAERIRTELDKMIMGNKISDILINYRDVIAVFIPEFIPCFDLDQQTKHHNYDVYDHIAKSVEYAKKDYIIRLCMLFHDIAKPVVLKNGKFKGHQIPGAEMTYKIMKRLCYDNKTINSVTKLIAEHDNRYPCDRQTVIHYIADHGYKFFLNQLDVRLADTLAQSLYDRENKIKLITDTLNLGKEVMENHECPLFDELKVNGNDLIALGLSDGKDIGETLNTLYQMVLDKKLKNTKNDLISYVKSII